MGREEREKERNNPAFNASGMRLALYKPRACVRTLIAGPVFPVSRAPSSPLSCAARHEKPK